MAVMGFREPNRARWVGVRPAHDGAEVYNKADATNATVVVYTVPAGKVLHLTSLHVCSRATLAAGEVIVDIRNAAHVIQVSPFDHYYAAVGQMSDDISFWPPMELPAGWEIAVRSTNANSWGCLFVRGWIENA